MGVYDRIPGPCSSASVHLPFAGNAISAVARAVAYGYTYIYSYIPSCVRVVAAFRTLPHGDRLVGGVSYLVSVLEYRVLKYKY
jgi:hypothetical protein